MMDNNKKNSFFVDEVKHLFYCLDDIDSVHSNQNISEQCCDFLNNSSDDITNIIYNPDSNSKEANKKFVPDLLEKIKKIKTFKEAQNVNEYNPESCDASDDFSNILSVLSTNIEKLQRDFQKILINCDTTNLYLNKFNLIQCELVKIKHYLTFKTNDQPNVDSFQLYNLNIIRIVNNRFLILQLLHFECILFHYLKSIELIFPTQSNLSQEIVISQLQSLFRCYYTLLIKLSYEIPFVQVIRILHRKSSTITTDILLLFSKIINSKLKQNNDNKESYHQELFDSIINNRSIVIILDYIIILSKIGLLYMKKNVFKNIKFEKSSNDQFDFDNMTKVAHEFLNNEFIPSPQINLVNFGYLILSYFCSMDKFLEKSSLRSRTIIMLHSICQKLQYHWDQFSSILLLMPTIIELLKCFNEYHIQICQGSLLSLEKEDIILANRGEKSIEKEIRLKSYMSVLRDMNGIISLLLVFTKSSITNQYLRFLGLDQILFQKFMQPFVYWLNGTENLDPDFNNVHSKNNMENSYEAYAIIRIYKKQYNRIVQYSNRLITMSSMVIQRLLPPLISPLEDSKNPFYFPLFNSDNDDIQVLTSSLKESDNDFDVDDEDLFNFPVSDEENSDMLNESEIDEINEDKEKIDDMTLIKSYLAFFPETKLLKSNDEDSIATKLLCSCNDSYSASMTSFNHNKKHETLAKNPADQQNKNINPDNNYFNWKESFIKEYNSTKSIIPKQFIPKPELNLYLGKQQNDSIQPMTYPFLKQIIRYKNYSQIKLLDHVNERLNHDLNFKYELLYDIENKNDFHQQQQNDTNGSNINSFLKFESRFECGNLRKVFFKSSNANNNENEEEYLLLLNSDVNSSSHMQWFYFAVSQMKTNKRYRFKIINCEKKSILFNKGQQPLFYSCREFEASSKGWQRIGNYKYSYQNIVAYYRNHYVKKSNFEKKFKSKPYYTLEFTFEFPFDQDECYFAFTTPFSFSLLKSCISYWSYIVEKSNNQSRNKIFFSSQTLCSTLNGNELPLITITSNSTNCRDDNNKHYIMITARVHPAESNSSWILKGFIDFLLFPNSDPAKEEAKMNLLEKFIFKIVPMINPDGVINGCTRTDLQAEDLNRHWDNPSLVMHPTIYHTKMFLQCLKTYSEGRNPVAFLDIHGHSRLHNIFSYSCFQMLSWKKSDSQNFRKQFLQNHNCLCEEKNNCQLKNQIESLKSEDNVHFLTPPFTILPLVLEYQRTPAFDIENCSFLMQRDREGTARVVSWRQFEIPLSYTIECSTSGCEKGPYIGQNLSHKQLEEMGQYIATSFNFIKFLFCSQKHLPLIIWPKKPIKMNEFNCFDEETNVIDILLSKCVRSKNTESSPKKQEIKQMILKLYPDLKEMASYFQK